MRNAGELRQRALDTLEYTVKQFRTRERLHPLRVPREPVPLDAVLRQALGSDADRLDPRSLGTRTVLHLGWDDGSAWDLWILLLPSGLRLFCDSGDEGARILASGGRNAGDASERLFLELLAESAGEEFGIEMSGGPPSRVRCAIQDRELLVNVFTDLFEGAGMEASFRADESGLRTSPTQEDGRDFRRVVEQWLERALHNPEPR